MAVPSGADVDQLGGEVGICSRGGGVEVEDDRASDFRIVFEWRRGVDQYVVAGFDFSLIARAGRKVVRVAAELASDGRNGIGWVVDEAIGTPEC